MNHLKISECGVKFLGQVSFIRDSGKNIFVRGRFEIFWNRFEISLYFSQARLMVAGHVYEGEECQPKWEVNGGKGEF